MVKFIDDEYDFETGLLSIPKGGGLSLLVLKDEEGAIHTVTKPTVKDVEELCERHNLDAETLMTHIAGLDDETSSLLIKLSDYRVYDVAKKHGPKKPVPSGSWFMERWILGRPNVVWGGNTAREVLLFVRAGIEDGAWHVERIIGPEGEVYSRDTKAWSELCSREGVHV